MPSKDRFSTTLRAVSLFLAFTLTLEPLAYASPIPARGVFAKDEKTRVDLPVPTSVATVEDARLVPGQKTVYLLQDAHTNASAQFNMAALLEALFEEETSLRTVFVEAGFGNDTLTAFKPFTPAADRKRNAAALVRQGYLGGEEYLNLTSDIDFTIWGVENKALYDQAVENYRRTRGRREQLGRYLDSIELTLQTLDSRVLNPVLLPFDAKRRAYAAGKLPLTDYLNALETETSRLGLSGEKGGELAKLSALRASEKAIDFEAVRREQAQALLSLSEEDRKELAGHTPKMLQAKEEGENAYYARLEEKLAAQRAQYPGLSAYLEYRKKARGLDLKKTIEQITELESRVLDALTLNAEEKTFLDVRALAADWRKLFTFTMTPDEFSAYASRSGRVPPTEAIGFLNRKIKELGSHYERALFLEDGFEDVLKTAESFYGLTLKRDETFVKNVVEKMNEAGLEKSVLIAGGYHTANLKELLKARGISFVSITPQVLHETNLKRYEEVLLGDAFAARPVMMHAAAPKMTDTLHALDNPPFYAESFAPTFAPGQDASALLASINGARLAANPRLVDRFKSLAQDAAALKRAVNTVRTSGSADKKTIEDSLKAAGISGGAAKKAAAGARLSVDLTRESQRLEVIAAQTATAELEKDRWSPKDYEIISTNMLDWLAADDAIVPAEHKAAIRKLLDSEDAGKLKNGFLNPNGIIWPGTAGFRGPMENLEEGKIGPNYIGVVLMRQYADIYRSYIADKRLRGEIADGAFAYGVGEVRLNTAEYGNLLSLGMAEAGVKVVQYYEPKRRPFSTPLASHAAQYLAKKFGQKPVAGYTISGSHNGLADNGVKLFNEAGAQLLPNDVAQIKPYKHAVSDIRPFKSAEELKSEGLLVEFTDAEYEELLNDYYDAIEKTMDPAFKETIRRAVDEGFRFVYTPINGSTLEETRRFLVERLGLEEGKHFLVPQDETVLPQNDLSHPAWKYANFDPARKGILDKAAAFADQNGIKTVMARDLDGDRFVIGVKTERGWVYLDGNQNSVLMLDDALKSLQDRGETEEIENFVMMRTHVTSPLLDTIALSYGVKKENIGVVPVGFKYFGAVIMRQLGQWFRRYRGFEESYGTSNGVDPEKDSLTGMLNLMVVAAKAYSDGRRDVYDQLLRTYEKFGYTGDVTTPIAIPGAGPAEQAANKAKSKAVLGSLKQGDLIEGRYRVAGVSHEFVEPLFSSETLVDGYRLMLEDTTDGRRVFMIIRESGTEPIFKYYFFWADPLAPQAGQSAGDIVDATQAYLAGSFRPTIQTLFDKSWSAAPASGARLSSQEDPDEAWETAGARLALQTIDPTTTSAWGNLIAAQKRIESVHLRTLFAENPDRAKQFTHEFTSGDAKLTFDFSKNRIDARSLRQLIGLARQTGLPDAIKRMFAGDKINVTENRAVGHVWLREPAAYRRTIDGQNVTEDVHRVLEHMREFSNAINDGEWKGYTGDEITDIVNIGIGGSDLGPVMASEALKPYATGRVRVHYVSNVDGTDFVEKVVKAGLDPKKTLFIIASKTFTTQETMTNAHSAREWFLKATNNNVEAIKKHFVAVSTAKDKVAEFGIDPANMFEFWDWVGGRYSMWSAIGLSVAAYIGFDNFQEVLTGAHDMDAHFENMPLEQNIPVLKALLGIWYRNFFGAETYAILPYDQNMHRVPAYLQQAVMESNGKGVDRAGKPISYKASSVIFGEAGTNGQHSFYQLFHQMFGIVPADFIGIVNSQNPIGDHHNKLLANFLAQTKALAFGKTREEVIADGVNPDVVPHRVFAGNNPTTSILINRLTPRALGSLIAAYEHQIFVEGVIMNVFSYDQWGVELGKVQAGPILRELEGKPSNVEQDSSTASLLSLIASQRGARLAEGSSTPILSRVLAAFFVLTSFNAAQASLFAQRNDRTFSEPAYRYVTDRPIANYPESTANGSAKFTVANKMFSELLDGEELIVTVQGGFVQAGDSVRYLLRGSEGGDDVEVEGRGVVVYEGQRFPPYFIIREAGRGFRTSEVFLDISPRGTLLLKAAKLRGTESNRSAGSFGSDRRGSSPFDNDRGAQPRESSRADDRSSQRGSSPFDRTDDRSGQRPENGRRSSPFDDDRGASPRDGGRAGSGRQALEESRVRGASPFDRTDDRSSRRASPFDNDRGASPRENGRVDDRPGSSPFDSNYRGALSRENGNAQQDRRASDNRSAATFERRDDRRSFGPQRRYTYETAIAGNPEVLSDGQVRFDVRNGQSLRNDEELIVTFSGTQTGAAVSYEIRGEQDGEPVAFDADATLESDGAGTNARIRIPEAVRGFVTRSIRIRNIPGGNNPVLLKIGKLAGARLSEETTRRDFVSKASAFFAGLLAAANLRGQGEMPLDGGFPIPDYQIRAFRNMNTIFQRRFADPPSVDPSRRVKRFTMTINEGIGSSAVTPREGESIAILLHGARDLQRTLFYVDLGYEETGRRDFNSSVERPLRYVSFDNVPVRIIEGAPALILNVGRLPQRDFRQLEVATVGEPGYSTAWYVYRAAIGKITGATASNAGVSPSAGARLALNEALFFGMRATVNTGLAGLAIVILGTYAAAYAFGVVQDAAPFVRAFLPEKRRQYGFSVIGLGEGRYVIENTSGRSRNVSQLLEFVTAEQDRGALYFSDYYRVGSINFGPGSVLQAPFDNQLHWLITPKQNVTVTLEEIQGARLAAVTPQEESRFRQIGAKNMGVSAPVDDAALLAHLNSIAKQMVPPTGGVQAADESTGSMDKWLLPYSLENNAANRQAARRMLLTAKGLKTRGIDSVILDRDTISNVDASGRSLLDHLKEEGVLPGLKTDSGLADDLDSPLVAHPDPKKAGEMVRVEKLAKEQGLLGLGDLLEKFAGIGLVFTKWRAVVAIDPQSGLPREENIRANMQVLARQAKLTQLAGLVPIVEPEVLLDGSHSIEDSYKATTRSIEILFEELAKENVWLPGMILKTSMILSGKSAQNRADAKTVGRYTLRGLLKTVPAEVPSIVFLSGGQGDSEVNENLNEISLARLNDFETIRDEAASELEKEGKGERAALVRALTVTPYEISYSFGRGLVGPGYRAWAGNDDNTAAAQEALRQAAATSQKARQGLLHAGARLAAQPDLGAAPEMDIPVNIQKVMKEYGLSLESVRVGRVQLRSDGHADLIEPLSFNEIDAVPAQAAFAVSLVQAMSGSAHAGILSQIMGRRSLSAGRDFGKVIDAAAVVVGRKALETIAKALRITIIVGGNEGNFRDQSADLKVGMVINKDSKNGTYIYFGDSVEVTNGVKRDQGRPGTSSMILLVPAPIMPSTDGYRISLAVDKFNPAKPLPSIDPVITGVNTLKHVLTQIAQYMDADDADAFIRQMAGEYKLATLDRPKHDQLKAQARELGFEVVNREDGDPQLFIRAMLGVRGDDGKKLLAVSTGGANEHLMALAFAAMSKKGMMFSTNASTEALKDVDKKEKGTGNGSLDRAREFSAKDLEQFESVNAAFEHLKGLNYHLPKGPSSPEELGRQILNGNSPELAALKNEKTPAAFFMVSNTGANALDWGELSRFVRPVTWHIEPSGQGRVTVNGFFIGNNGQTNFFEAKLKAEDATNSRYMLMASAIHMGRAEFRNALLEQYDEARTNLKKMLDAGSVDQDAIAPYVRITNTLLDGEKDWSLIVDVLEKAVDAATNHSKTDLLISSLRQIDEYILGNPSVTMENGFVYPLVQPSGARLAGADKNDPLRSLFEARIRAYQEHIEEIFSGIDSNGMVRSQYEDVSMGPAGGTSSGAVLNENRVIFTYVKTFAPYDYGYNTYPMQRLAIRYTASASVEERKAALKHFFSRVLYSFEKNAAFFEGAATSALRSVSDNAFDISNAGLVYQAANPSGQFQFEWDDLTSKISVFSNNQLLLEASIVPREPGFSQAALNAMAQRVSPSTGYSRLEGALQTALDGSGYEIVFKPYRGARLAATDEQVQSLFGQQTASSLTPEMLTWFLETLGDDLRVSKNDDVFFFSTEKTEVIIDFSTDKQKVLISKSNISFEHPLSGLERERFIKSLEKKINVSHGDPANLEGARLAVDRAIIRQLHRERSSPLLTRSIYGRSGAFHKSFSSDVEPVSYRETTFLKKGRRGAAETHTAEAGSLLLVEIAGRLDLFKDQFYVYVRNRHDDPNPLSAAARLIPAAKTSGYLLVSFPNRTEFDRIEFRVSSAAVSKSRRIRVASAALIPAPSEETRKLASPFRTRAENDAEFSRQADLVALDLMSSSIPWDGARLSSTEVRYRDFSGDSLAIMVPEDIIAQGDEAVRGYIHKQDSSFALNEEDVFIGERRLAGARLAVAEQPLAERSRRLSPTDVMTSVSVASNVLPDDVRLFLSAAARSVQGGKEQILPLETVLHGPVTLFWLKGGQTPVARDAQGNHWLLDLESSRAIQEQNLLEKDLVKADSVQKVVDQIRGNSANLATAADLSIASAPYTAVVHVDAISPAGKMALADLVRKARTLGGENAHFVFVGDDAPIALRLAQEAGLKNASGELTPDLAKLPTIVLTSADRIDSIRAQYPNARFTILPKMAEGSNISMVDFDATVRYIRLLSIQSLEPGRDFYNRWQGYDLGVGDFDQLVRGLSSQFAIRPIGQLLAEGARLAYTMLRAVGGSA